MHAQTPLGRTQASRLIPSFIRSENFKLTLTKLLEKTPQGDLALCFNGTTEVFCSREIRVAGAIGGCTALPGRNPNAVAETEVGLGGTSLFRVNTLTPRVAVAFFFEARGAM